MAEVRKTISKIWGETQVSKSSQRQDPFIEERDTSLGFRTRVEPPQHENTKGEKTYREIYAAPRIQPTYTSDTPTNETQRPMMRKDKERAAIPDCLVPSIQLGPKTPNAHTPHAYRPRYKPKIKNRQAQRVWYTIKVPDKDNTTLPSRFSQSIRRTQSKKCNNPKNAKDVRRHISLAIFDMMVSKNVFFVKEKKLP